MTTYEDSQSLINGQKQHSKETAKIFSLDKYAGMTLEQTSHCKKFTKLCGEMDWDEDIAALILECTPGDIVNIRKGITPISQTWAMNLLQKKGIRLSTLRLDTDVDNLKKARQIRYKEIYDTHKVAGICSYLKKSKPLFNVDITVQKMAAITKLNVPLLGRGLKAFRAMTGDTQYSLADKIALHCPKGSWRTREFWHNVETKNSISVGGAMAFYKTFGITIEEAISPYMNYLTSKNIDLYFDYDKAKYMLDMIEAEI